jgi:hypothetical protein
MEQKVVGVSCSKGVESEDGAHVEPNGCEDGQEPAKVGVAVKGESCQWSDGDMDQGGCG